MAAADRARLAAGVAWLRLRALLVFVVQAAGLAAAAYGAWAFFRPALTGEHVSLYVDGVPAPPVPLTPADAAAVVAAGLLLAHLATRPRS